MSLISRVETDPGESKLRMVVRCGCGGGGGSGAGKVEAWVSAKSNCPVWVLEIEFRFEIRGRLEKSTGAVARVVNAFGAFLLVVVLAVGDNDTG